MSDTVTIDDPRVRAFLGMVIYAEGTNRKGADPFRVVYGYGVTLRDLSNHPVVTREWTGKRLQDRYCIAAGLRPGCKSTAAGAYQINYPTWTDRGLRRRYNPKSFEPDEQSRFAWHALVADSRATDLVLNGNIAMAIGLCSGRWASLPGVPNGQPQKQMVRLLAVYDDILKNLKEARA